MLELSVEKLKPGMIAAQGIYSRDGASYLSVGAKITAEDIVRLKNMGIVSLHIAPQTENGQQPVVPQNIVEEETASSPSMTCTIRCRC